MKPLNHIFTILILLFGLNSCDRIKNKSEKVANEVKVKTRKKLKVQTQKVIDKVFPPFDHDKADTKNNKNRFRDFLKVEITPDVNNLFCFDDAIGIDVDYMFAFNCNSTTSRQIIIVNKLTLDTTNSDYGFDMQHNFEWWDKERIKDLNKYSWTNGNQYYKYYWYDVENRKAYFFEFNI